MRQGSAAVTLLSKPLPHAACGVRVLIDRRFLTLNWATAAISAPQVVNDMFASRATLAWPSSTTPVLSVTGSTSRASFELDELSSVYSSRATAPTVYYKITAGSTGDSAPAACFRCLAVEPLDTVCESPCRSALLLSAVAPYRKRGHASGRGQLVMA